MRPRSGAEDDEQELEARWANAWRPEEVAGRLAGVRTPWCVAGGWALDLFRGARSREHADLEIAVPEADFPEVRAASRSTCSTWRRPAGSGSPRTTTC